VREALRDLLIELSTDPYPRPGRLNVSEVKGTNYRHLYVAWCDEARVAYRVAQDQPVILLVAVHWFGPPDGPDDGDNGEWDFALAA
jgi:hypothetical protein